MLYNSTFIIIKYIYYTYSDINSRDVHVLVSALGIHFLLIGVSKVTGKIETTIESRGRPLSLEAKDLVKWWTAALAIP